MANTDKIIAGYPQAIGAKIQTVVDHAGPASYTTGGETYSISNINQGAFDRVDGGYSYSATVGGAGGTYSVTAIWPAGTQGVEPTSILLKWFVVGGAEVSAGTNLNGQYVRLNIFSC